MMRTRAPWLLTLSGFTALVVACKDNGTEPQGIGSGGGTVAASGGGASVTIPAGALSQATMISVSPASSAPAGNVGTAYDFGPNGTTFALPVTITLTYDGSALPAGVIPADLVLARAVGGQWQPVAGSNVHTGAETVSGPATDFSTWGIVPLVTSGVTAQAWDSQVTIDWTAVLNATSYNLYWKAGEGGVTTNDNKITGATRPYVHTGLTNDTQYFYIVTGVNAVGEGSPSAEASATPRGVPRNVVAEPWNEQVTLSWDAVEGAETYNIYYNQTGGVTTSDQSILGVTMTSFVHEGLTNGGTYYYRVSAVSFSEIEGPLSGEVLATANPPTPAQPQNLAAEPTDEQVSLSWTAVEGAETYNIYYNQTGGVTTSDQSILGVTMSSFVHEGLTNGATYHYRVSAVNVFEVEGSLSAEVSATLPPEPAQPQNLVTEPSDQQVSLSWDAVEGAETYNIYYKLGTGGVTQTIAGVTMTSFVHEGLTNGDTYFYRVSAVNVFDIEGPLSMEVSATVNPPTPAQPQNLVAAPADQQVSLSWDAVEGAETYNIYYKLGTGGVTQTIAGVTMTSFVHEGLTNGNTYYYRVSAVNVFDVEGPLSTEVSAEVTVPPQPQNVQAVAGVMNVTVSWDALAGATGYNIYWKSGTGGVTTGDQQIEVPAGATEYAHTGLQAGTPYFYIVTALNAVGEGPPSAEVSATPTAGAQAVQVAADRLYAGPATCAVMSDGTVMCVGWYPGNGSDYSATPVQVTGISSATQVSVGSSNSCAVLSDGTVQCWGRGVGGQLGNGANNDSLTPVTVSDISAATAVEVGTGFSCAIDGGAVRCWGAGGGGTLGDGMLDTSSNVPVDVPVPGADQLSLAELNARACARNGIDVWCWGTLPVELGQNQTDCDFALCPPVQVPGVVASWIALGRTHACYLDNTFGEVTCLGAADGQFLSPLDETLFFDQVSAGEDFNCALAGGSVTCWGWNGQGQLGDGTSFPHPAYPYSTPVDVVGVSGATSLSAGQEHTCVVEGGVVKCWGLGFGSTPTVVIGGS